MLETLSIAVASTLDGFEDGFEGEQSMFDDSVIIPSNIESMSVESMELMHCDLADMLRRAEHSLELRRKEQTMAFDSFERLTFFQKHIRRDSKTKNVINHGIYTHSVEIAQLIDRIQRLKSKLRYLNALGKTMNENASLKEKHKKWREGEQHSQVGFETVPSGDMIFMMDVRLSLSSLCFHLTLRLLGKFIQSNRAICDPFQNEEDLYESLTRLKRRLIFAAQACDETRSGALPFNDAQAEFMRINCLTDSAYASEIFMMAGVDGWVITADEEKRAVGIYNYEKVKEIQRKELNARLDAEKINADRFKFRTPSDRLEINISDLMKVDRVTFLDQISVTKNELQLLQKSLDKYYQRYDCMSLPQKFFRRKSFTKGEINKDIYNQSLKIKLLWDELRYWKEELKRLDEIKESCANVFKRASIEGLEQHNLFCRSNYDGILTSIDNGSFETAHGTSFTAQEIKEFIIAYDIALKKIDETIKAEQSCLSIAKAQTHSVNDNELLIPTEEDCNDNDIDIDIDCHVSESVIRDCDVLSGKILKPVNKPTSSVVKSETVLMLEVLVQNTQYKLMEIPLDLVYWHQYALKLNELENMKSIRHKAGVDMGISHFNGYYINEFSKCLEVNKVNHKLIELARLVDEMRIHAMPETERSNRLCQLKESTDTAYIGTIMVSAGVQGWNISKREKKLFLNIGSKLEKKKKALTSQLLVKKPFPTSDELRISPI